MGNSYKFERFTYEIVNNVLTNNEIDLSLEELFNGTLKHLNPDAKVIILFNVHTTSMEAKTITPIQIASKTDIKTLKETFKLNWKHTNGHFKAFMISTITYRYLLIDNPKSSYYKALSTYFTRCEKTNSDISLIEPFELANTNNLLNWGEEITILDDFLCQIFDGDFYYIVLTVNKERFVYITYKEKYLLYFHDLSCIRYHDYSEKDSDTFIRHLNNNRWYYIEGIKHLLD